MSQKDQTKEFSWNIYKRLLGFTRPYLTRMILGVFCGVLYGATAFGLIIVIYWAVGALSGDAMGEGVVRLLEALHLDQFIEKKLRGAKTVGLKKGNNPI